MIPDPLPPALEPRRAGGGAVHDLPGEAWELAIPTGPGHAYRLAQLDDYLDLPRSRFRWQPPLTLHIRARASAPDLPGTWGFGLWNDPFTASTGLGGAARRLPSLPNCAWFFYASPPNYLSLRDDLPASGMLAAVFRSARIPAPAAAAGTLLLPMLWVPALARTLRRWGRHWVSQSAELLEYDLTREHEYALTWSRDQVEFFVDGVSLHRSAISPIGPLGFVLWIDNQYAAFPPSGRVGFGSLPNPQPVSLEISGITISRPEL